MRGDDQREPLWASSLADQPRPDYAVILPEEDEHDEEPPRSDAPLRVASLAVAVALVAVIAIVARAGWGSITIDDVPSRWEQTPMKCDTTRLEEGDRAIELFTCEALGGGTLPPGVYESPGARWTSDITRRDAQANGIEISRDGELTGWAVYGLR